MLSEVEDETNDIQEINTKTILNEAKTLVALALPVLASYVVSFSNVMAPVFSLGHLGTKYLAASALSTMLCNVTGFSIGNGLATALDTLCSQSFTGSNDKHALGMKFQFLSLIRVLTFRKPSATRNPFDGDYLVSYCYTLAIH